MRKICVLLFIAAAGIAAGCGNKATVAKRAAVEFERFAALPSTADDYFRIFGRHPSAPQLASTRAALNLAQRDGVRLLPAVATSGTVADIVVERLRAPTGARILTLIGHNDEGLFRFPDGSSLRLADLQLLAPGKIPVAISCESARYSSGLRLGLPTPVTVQVAQLTESLFVARLNALAEEGQSITPAAAQAELEAALVQAVQHLRAERVMKVAIPGAVGITIWEQVQADPFNS